MVGHAVPHKIAAGRKRVAPRAAVAHRQAERYRAVAPCGVGQGVHSRGVVGGVGVAVNPHQAVAHILHVGICVAVVHREVQGYRAVAVRDVAVGVGIGGCAVAGSVQRAVYPAQAVACGMHSGINSAVTHRKVEGNDAVAACGVDESVGSRGVAGGVCYAVNPHQAVAGGLNIGVDSVAVDGKMQGVDAGAAVGGGVGVIVSAGGVICVTRLACIGGIIVPDETHGEPFVAAATVRAD